MIFSFLIKLSPLIINILSYSFKYYMATLVNFLMPGVCRELAPSGYKKTTVFPDRVACDSMATLSGKTVGSSRMS